MFRKRFTVTFKIQLQKHQIARITPITKEIALPLLSKLNQSAKKLKLPKATQHRYMYTFQRKLSNKPQNTGKHFALPLPAFSITTKMQVRQN